MTRKEKMRKTVSVEWMKSKANEFLANSDDELAEQRKGVSALLEATLFHTGNYRGFTYLASEFGEVPNMLRPNYDDTRRSYL